MTSRTALMIFSLAIGALALGLLWISPSPMPDAYAQMLNALVWLLAASGLSFLAINSVQKQ
jgi:hypothetical protein